jgi:PAS domain S-box-containing protein
MDDDDKTREELLSELSRLRRQFAEFEPLERELLPREALHTAPDRITLPVATSEGAEWSNHHRLEKTTRLLQAMNAAQDRFISNGDPRQLFDGLLGALLSVTESQYGFIDEVYSGNDGSVYRQAHAITNIAWDEETRASYEELARTGFKFVNLKSLTGAVVTTAEPVIANDPSHDPRRGGLPPGHPPIHSFLGLPLASGGSIVGVVGAANRPGGYSQELVAFLQPYLDTCANIIIAYRNEQRRREAENALRAEQDQLEKRVEERTADLRRTNLMLQEEIAERKRISQALSESETRYRMVFENAGDAILLMEAVGDQAGRIVSANQAAAEIHGYTLGEIIGMNITDLDPSARAAKAIDRRKRLLRGERVKEEVEHRRKDGTVFPVEICAALIELGNEKYFLATDRDITDRKLAEKVLRESERKYREFAEFLPQIVYELDERGDVTFINRAGWQAGGYSRDEVDAGLHIMQLCAPHDRERVARDFARLMSGENILGNEYVALRKNGETFPIVTYMSPITRDGEIKGIRGVAVDISDLKRAVEVSQELRIEAEKANRAKSEFLANMSHELRTPLNAVIGFSEVLEDQLFGPLSETQLKYMGYIVSSGRHLLRLIDDLLDLARIESGRMRLNLSEVIISDLLKNSLVMIKDTVSQHRLKLELCVAHELTISPIQADEVRLKQIVCNLLSNATKFTPDDGRIEVRARKSGDELIVMVTDTGIGIDPSDQKRIFKIFEQVDASSSRLGSGTGLGLALTRNLVELHGGRIWVESRGQGRGSVFAFSIPLGGPPQDESLEFKDVTLPGETASDSEESPDDSWIHFRVLHEGDDPSHDS